MTKMLRNVLLNILNPDEMKYLSASFDIIGNIVIIKIPAQLADRRIIIANTILERIKSVRSVFCQSSGVKGDYRIRELEFLSGVNNVVTTYKEHGCTFKVDVARTYFSPRLSTERLRIANLIEPNEIVVNMFGGLGTYSILIACKNKTVKVYSIDTNIIAHELCIANSEINKVRDRVFSIHGDAIDVITNKLRGVANRVLMPLPERAKEFIDVAILALKNGCGLIHFFSHIRASNRKSAVAVADVEIKECFSKFNYTIKGIRVVREVGPKFYQVVSDVAIM
jgi:tRNA (guanine37-N1)-methyltransferase